MTDPNGLITPGHSAPGFPLPAGPDGQLDRFALDRGVVAA